MSEREGEKGREIGVHVRVWMSVCSMFMCNSVLLQMLQHELHKAIGLSSSYIYSVVQILLRCNLMYVLRLNACVCVCLNE